MAGEAEDLERLLRALKESAEDIEDFDEIVKNVNKTYNRWVKDLKDSQPPMKAFRDFLGGVKKPLLDVTDEVKKFDEAIKRAKDAQEDLVAAELEYKKETLQSMVASKNAGIATRNFAIGIGSATKSLLSGVTDFVKGLQGSQEGTELTGEAAVKAVETTEKVTTALGELTSGIGGALLFFKKFRILGLVLDSIGIGLETLGPELSTAAQNGLRILNTEVEKTKKSFRDITGTGAEFAGGMTELRAIARMAGLDIGQLSAVVKNNVEALSNMGLGLADATRRFTGISREIRNSELGIQLRKLGLNVEEQGEVALQTAAYLNSAGRLRQMSDKDVAAATVAYTKDLKILQGVTGEDAKKAMEKARMQALEADLLARAMAEGGPDAVLKLQKQLAATPEAYKKGALEFLSSGGRAIQDQATLVAMNYNPMLRRQYESMLNDLRDTSVDASQAQYNIQRSNEQTAKFARDNVNAFQPISFGARFTGDALLQGATDIYNQMILYGTKAIVGTTDKVIGDVEKSTTNMAPLDDNIARLDEDVQKLKSSLGAELTGAITSYTGALLKSTERLTQFGNTLGDVASALKEQFRVKSTAEKVGSAGGGIAGSVAGGLAGRALFGGLGSFLGPAGTMAGMAAGGYLGEKVGSFIGEQFAEGGVARGPTSGYQTQLHGVEAVVPLPDNRSIPVTLTKDSEVKSSNTDMMAINASMNQQSTLLNEILRTLKDGNNIQSGILQASY